MFNKYAKRKLNYFVTNPEKKKLSNFKYSLVYRNININTKGVKGSMA